MPKYNHCEFIGHLGRDPETRYSAQGMAITSFSIAVNNSKKVDGEWKDFTLWIKVTYFGKLAESAAQHLSKGQAALVAGRIDVEEWTGNDGKPRHGLTLIGSEFVSLGEKSQSDAPPRASKPQPPQKPDETAPDISDDDIPF